MELSYPETPKDKELNENSSKNKFYTVMLAGAAIVSCVELFQIGSKGNNTAVTPPIKPSIVKSHPSKTLPPTLSQKINLAVQDSGQKLASKLKTNNQNIGLDCVGQNNTHQWFNTYANITKPENCALINSGSAPLKAGKFLSLYINNNASKNTKPYYNEAIIHPTLNNNITFIASDTNNNWNVTEIINQKNTTHKTINENQLPPSAQETFVNKFFSLLRKA